MDVDECLKYAEQSISEPAASLAREVRRLRDTRRFEAACAAPFTETIAKQLRRHAGKTVGGVANVFAEWSVVYADALIAELERSKA